MKLSATLIGYGESARKEAATVGEGYDWKPTYHQVFCNTGSRQIAQLLAEVKMELNWDDPDTTYEEDVKAYLRALEEKRKELLPLFPPAAV